MAMLKNDLTTYPRRQLIKKVTQVDMLRNLLSNPSELYKTLDHFYIYTSAQMEALRQFNRRRTGK